jgi:hypothetical protein
MRVIQEYGEITIIKIPDEDSNCAEIYEILEGEERVELPLWTNEEGKSDLYIYFLCSYNNSQSKIEVCNIYVP